MDKIIKQIILLVILLVTSSTLFGLENNNKTIKINKFSDNNTLFLNNMFQNKDLVKNDFIYGKTRKYDLYKTGVNLLIFGVVSGVVGGGFFAGAAILTWVLSIKMNWTFSQAFISIFTASTIFGEYSVYASLAIASWVLGGVFSLILFLFIPGVILMAIGSRRISKKISPLNNGIGVSFKF